MLHVEGLAAVEAHGARYLTARAWSAFSSGDASGLKLKAKPPAFLDSSTKDFSASWAVTLLSGSRAASATPWDLSSATCDCRLDIILENCQLRLLLLLYHEAVEHKSLPNPAHCRFPGGEIELELSVE